MTARQIFAIDRDAVARFIIGQDIDDQDRHGQRVKGRVVEVKLGNRIALVVVQAKGEC
jgi:3-methyladenine DNA glycosylase Mpg